MNMVKLWRSGQMHLLLSSTLNQGQAGTGRGISYVHRVNTSHMNLTEHSWRTSRTSGADRVPRARLVLLHLKLRSTLFSPSARSVSSRIDKEVGVPAGGTPPDGREAKREQNRRGVDDLWLY